MTRPGSLARIVYESEDCAEGIKVLVRSAGPSLRVIIRAINRYSPEEALL